MSSITFDQIRQYCLSLPDTKETLTWGQPHFRVGEKIFCGAEVADGILTVGFKLDAGHAAQRVKLPGFERAPYVGHRGWVSMDASQVRDWQDVCDVILESYRLIAPKSTSAKLDCEPVRRANAPNRKTAAAGTPRKKI